MLMWVLLGDYYSVTLPFYSVTLVGNLSLLPVKMYYGNKLSFLFFFINVTN